MYIIHCISHLEDISMVYGNKVQVDPTLILANHVDPICHAGTENRTFCHTGPNGSLKYSQHVARSRQKMAAEGVSYQVCHQCKCMNSLSISVSFNVCSLSHT